ncbi:hypothetical protein EDC94DRAFT_607877 [Helicostylum pulchrum]|nr:hypothetical protein EDC94DRAFT_607877 [Helicostylum pulchrum]
MSTISVIATPSITSSPQPSSPKMLSFIPSTNNSTTSLFQQLKKNSISSMPTAKQQSMSGIVDSETVEQISESSLKRIIDLEEQRKDMGPSIHSTGLDSTICPNTVNYDTTRPASIIEEPITLFPLETTQSSPLPLTCYPTPRHTLDRPLSSSTISLNNTKKHRRRITTPDLGNLDPEEQAALEAEITARRQARRVSRRNMSYSEQGEIILDQRYEEEDDERVMIGTRVSEGHRNYHLMYDMLTGIRIAVGRVSAKIQKELTEDDFKAAHKLVFDVTGNELTPGVKYDFKFKDYAPWVFRRLREKFHIDAADYMMSLTNKYILSELGSPGKSGSFFYYSRDYRFIIKTIHHTEHKFMRKILKQYCEHVSNNPNTLLCRFYGLHRIKLPHGRKIHFVVMGNVFPSNKDVHETYDLKGSTFGRLTSEEEIARNPHAVLKDLNWADRERKLEFGSMKRTMFINQLHIDVKLLASLNIMDYSLLIGFHDILKGNTEGIRDNNLHVVTPHTKEMERSISRNKRESRADIVRKAIKFANPVQLDSSQLPESPSDERKYCVFYSEDGGFISTDEIDQATDKLYFLGVIDILTPYNFMKKTEHLFKSFTQNKTTISAINPIAYGKRFIHFMENVVTVNLKKQQ